MEGDVDELDTPHQHEQIGCEHAQFEETTEIDFCVGPEKSRQHADTDVQIFAIADDRGQKRHHDHQEHGHRLGPGGSTVENITAEHAVGDDEGNHDKTGAGDKQAGAMEYVHRFSILSNHGPPDFRRHFRARRRCEPPESCYVASNLFLDFRARELRPQAPNNRIRYFTSCMRLTIASYFGPYLSHTGLTASWKAFLSASETWMIWIPAALAFSIACCS